MIQHAPFYSPPVSVKNPLLTGLLRDHTTQTANLYSVTKQIQSQINEPSFKPFARVCNDVAEDVLSHLKLLRDYTGSFTAPTEVSAPQHHNDWSDSEWAKSLIKSYSRYLENVTSDIIRAEKMGDLHTSELLSSVARDIEVAIYFIESKIPQRS